MMRKKTFWVSITIFVILLILVPGLSGVQKASLHAQPFSGPVFVLLYHPWEEGFESFKRPFRLVEAESLSDDFLTP
jgi:hypothetical protein